MRRVLACLLTTGLTLGAGAALAEGYPGAGLGYNRPLRHDQVGAHPRLPPDAVLRRERVPRGLSRGYGYGYSHSYGSFYAPAFVTGGAGTIVETREIAPEPMVPTIPASTGIRPAPVGQPTLYVLNDTPRRPDARAGRGPRIVRVDAPLLSENGPQIVHLRVPRDRPRAVRR
ncbi:hypothetical protein [Salinarimonas soli]|uniref:Uncharacterized protein n=1 Tax=Salinarimonas soli TaxID=1638099 RepID=A0A5B2VB13_9HYPH|nr:hypothetical protein [Salinarimonas soli]KAA2235620.1 hypothetical protein F0L46_19170 [Salinarimonas soli]